METKNVKAIIYDLDNTIYSVKTIGEELFAPLFELIAASGVDQESFDNIKRDVMRKPLQVVAADYRFGSDLIKKGSEMLRSLVYEGDIRPFDDYAKIRNISGERFLVTTGFRDLQWSKIRKMGIDQDFGEIHIVDPDNSEMTKKDVFADIMDRKGYQPSEVWVVGDDPDSEIRAARELGIKTVLIDREDWHPEAVSDFKARDFTELVSLLQGG